jgi:hypothetical protein
MPHSVPVSDFMAKKSERPLLRAETPINDAIKILRIVTSDEKITHGHSTPLIVDDNRIAGKLPALPGGTQRKVRAFLQ